MGSGFMRLLRLHGLTEKDHERFGRHLRSWQRASFIEDKKLRDSSCIPNKLLKYHSCHLTYQS
jgi:hypothetical protein